MKRIFPLLLLLLLLTACGGRMDPAQAHESIQVIAMDTPMLLTAYGPGATKAVYDAEDVIRDLEARLSRTDPDSDVSRLNAAAGQPVEVGEDLLRLLDCSSRYSMATNGAFNINIAPIVSAWGFTEDSYQVPDQAELDALLEQIAGGPEYVSSPAGTLSMSAGYSIDLGGIAKGYTAGRIAEVFRENGVEQATAQLGGNVLAWGSRPGGDPWRVGIQDPARAEDAGAFAGILELTDAFAVTSGGYQRYFEQDGRRYHHIIDPATGRPADSGLTSVTVVAACDGGEASDADGASVREFPGAMCDAFSTALFVMGEEKALDFWRAWSGYPFQLVLITEDGRTVVTEGLADAFTPDEGSGYLCETVYDENAS